MQYHYITILIPKTGISRPGNNNRLPSLMAAANSEINLHRYYYQISGLWSYRWVLDTRVGS